MHPIRIEFQLEYAIRRDDDAKVFVAYIPMLRLFTQSRTQERLDEAVKDLVGTFVGLCNDRGILEDTLRERGMIRVDGNDDRDHAREQGEGQYIKVWNVEREVYEVPITLLAGERAMATCQQL